MAQQRAADSGDAAMRRRVVIGAFTVGLALGGPALAGTVLGTIQSYLATVQAKTSAYTLAATDCGTEIVVTVSATAAVTLPATLPIGCQVAVVQGGTAKVTLTAASGATLSSPHSFTGTYAQYSTIGAQVIANSGGSAAAWVFTGDGS